MRTNYTLLYLRLFVGTILISSVVFDHLYIGISYLEFLNSNTYLYIVTAFVMLNSFLEPLSSLITKNKKYTSYLKEDIPYFCIIFLLIFFSLLAQRYFDIVVYCYIFFVKYFIWNITNKLNSNLEIPHKTKYSMYEKTFLKNKRRFFSVISILGFAIYFYGAFACPYPLSERFAYLGVTLILISSSADSFSFIKYMLNQLITIFAHSGIIVKKKLIIENLSNTNTIVFNRGNVITNEEYNLIYVKSSKIEPRELLQLAAYGAYYSDHPISQAIKSAANPVDPSIIADFRFISGHGTSAHVNSKIIYVGNYKLMCQMGFPDMYLDTEATLIHIASDKTYLGCIGLENKIEPTAKHALEELNAMGISNTHIFTGDRYITTEKLAQSLNIAHIHSDLSAREKAQKLEEIKDSLPDKDRLLFVGGSDIEIPLITSADVGIYSGYANSEENVLYHMTLSKRDLSLIPLSIRLSRRAMKKVRKLSIINNLIKAMSIITVLLIPITPILVILLIFLSALISSIVCKRK